MTARYAIKFFSRFYSSHRSHKLLVLGLGSVPGSIKYTPTPGTVPILVTGYSMWCLAAKIACTSIVITTSFRWIAIWLEFDTLLVSDLIVLCY